MSQSKETMSNQNSRVSPDYASRACETSEGNASRGRAFQVFDFSAFSLFRVSAFQLFSLSPPPFP